MYILPQKRCQKCYQKGISFSALGYHFKIVVLHQEKMLSCEGHMVPCT